MRIPSPDVPGGFTASDADAESRRFARKVRRYILVGEDPRPMCDALTVDQPELAIVRIPAGRLDLLGSLRMLGAEAILCDCLSIWRRENVRLGPPAPVATPKDLHLRLAGSSDRAAVKAMIPAIFSGYRNHWKLNPGLRGFSLLDAYVEWALAYVAAPDRQCALAEHENIPCGFLTFEESPDESMIVLNGVTPAAQGQGVYAAMLRFALEHLGRQGSRITTVSTQVENSAVQRIWARHGFLPVQAFYTVHLNFSWE